MAAMQPAFRSRAETVTIEPFAMTVTPEPGTRLRGTKLWRHHEALVPRPTRGVSRIVVDSGSISVVFRVGVVGRTRVFGVWG